ncbi:MAG: elongation factor P [Chitinivibrionales bacterium]|nr:elongation factor P [Chitinivibrionales bacterium]
MSVIKGTQVRSGMIIVHNGEPHRVMQFRHAVTGRGSASIPIKLKNILTGAQAEITLRSDDKVERTEIQERDMEYLYEDGGEYWFMDRESYEQLSLTTDDVGDTAGYLIPGTVCKLQFYDGRAIGVVPPNSVQLRVTETEPAIKGATASGNVTKPATLETGLVIQVPMFVETGDTVIVSSVSGEYQGRPGRK